MEKESKRKMVKHKSIPNLTVPQQMRFWDKVNKTDSCWLWTASQVNNYGYIRIDSIAFLAHRISYKLHYREPGELEVCHECHIKLCVNPKHLFLGTHKENIQHSFDDNKITQKGELNANTKLTQEEINEIIKLLNEDILTQKQIAIRYNICRDTLWKIKRGTHWGIR